MPMGGKKTRKIWLERSKAWWTTKGLRYSFLAHLPRANYALKLARVAIDRRPLDLFCCDFDVHFIRLLSTLRCFFCR